MTKIVRGERVAKQGRLRLACSAVLFNPGRDRILLTRRTDNGEWCLPGGMVEPGETVAEGCVREVFEETGLQVRVVRLTGVYSDPNLLTVYPDGNRAAVVTLNFEVEALGGEAAVTDETTDIRYFLLEKAAGMPLFHNHNQRIRDAILAQEAAFIR